MMIITQKDLKKYIPVCILLTLMLVFSRPFSLTSNCLHTLLETECEISASGAVHAIANAAKRLSEQTSFKNTSNTLSPYLGNEAFSAPARPQRSPTPSFSSEAVFSELINNVFASVVLSESLPYSIDIIKIERLLE